MDSGAAHAWFAFASSNGAPLEFHDLCLVLESSNAKAWPGMLPVCQAEYNL